MLLNPGATFPLAVRLRTLEGAPIGEVFSFLSGLYFCGKLAYAQRFMVAGGSVPPVHIVTADQGLVSPETIVTIGDIARFADVDIGAGDPRYSGPLRRDAERLHAQLSDQCEVVLLGSIATGKYADTFLSVFQTRLVFPAAFVGRGDMSRGGLLLRHVRDGVELDYVPVAGTVRTGRRPAKLASSRDDVVE